MQIKVNKAVRVFTRGFVHRGDLRQVVQLLQALLRAQ